MSVQSVERTFSIIEFLSANPKPQQLAVISKGCSLPPATTHRLLETLCSLGYVKIEVGGFYSLTPKLFSMTSNAITGHTLISIAKPHLEELSNLLNESVHLVVRDGCDIIYVFKIVKMVGSIQMASHIGMRLPMYRTAAGKAILATLPESEVRLIFQESNVPPVTPNTITSVDELLQRLNVDRALGYSTDNEENELGITCIAMSLGTPQEDTRYAFSVSSLTSRMSPSRLESIAKVMATTQTRILNELVAI